jgi:hypothetical protein
MVPVIPPLPPPEPMSEVSIPVALFRERRLPPVCVRTGAPADAMVAVRANWTPAWTWWLLAGGVLPFLLARWLTRRHEAGWVPMSGPCASRVERVRQLAAGYLIAGITALFAGGVTGSPCLVQLGLAAIALVALAGLLEPAWLVGVRLDRSGEWVTLTRVHARFAAAVALQLARSDQ